jgi:DNA-binding transcriptional ArsR family regulator
VDINLIDGDELLRTLSALANPHRMRILATLLSGGPAYISQLARSVGISRPLLHLHLKKMEEAGLVTARHEISESGKALNFIDIVPFEISLSPRTITEAVRTLNEQPNKNGSLREQDD